MQNTPTTLRYAVATFRNAGLQARWRRDRSGAPVIFARCADAPHRHQRDSWWCVDAALWDDMNARGVRLAFIDATYRGNHFSEPA